MCDTADLDLAPPSSHTELVTFAVYHSSYRNLMQKSLLGVIRTPRRYHAEVSIASLIIKLKTLNARRSLIQSPAALFFVTRPLLVRFFLISQNITCRVIIMLRYPVSRPRCDKCQPHSRSLLPLFRVLLRAPFSRL